MAAASDEVFQLDLWRMCARDPLFWVNVFGWAYDSRLPPGLRKGPFILYEYQEEALLELVRAKGLLPGAVAEDILGEKSRDMGLSWLCILADVWGWLFQEMASFLWVSRKENLVDKAEDPDCLFWKADFTLKNAPGWLRPRHVRTRLHLFNLENGSTIDGESTTGDVARGGRRTSVLLDEFASVPEGEAVLSATADVTQCRVFNSTPKGTGNAFYTMRESSIKRLRFHWTLHPIKARGKWKDGEGRWHSPWYDAECKRRASKLEIAQELDIDYHASGSQFFDQDVLRQVQARDVRPAYKRGELKFKIYDGKVDVIGFVEDPRGRLLLWTHLGGGRSPLRNTDYVVGGDISAGSDASNSILTVMSVETGEKVAELATINVEPHELAAYAVALCKWFGGITGEAYLIWEANGPGAIFGRAVVKLGWRRMYYRRREESLRRKRSDQPGWYTLRESKNVLLGDYRAALADGSFIERNMEGVKEAKEYVYLPNGQPGFSRAQNVVDPSGAKKNHGDRVIANALCVQGARDVGKVERSKPREPVNCFAARQRDRRVQARRAREEAW